MKAEVKSPGLEVSIANGLSGFYPNIKNKPASFVAMLAASAVFVLFTPSIQAGNEPSSNTLQMSETVEYSMGEFPQSVALADLNNDDQLDIIAADRGGNSVSSDSEKKMGLAAIRSLMKPVKNRFSFKPEISLTWAKRRHFWRGAPPHF